MKEAQELLRIAKGLLGRPRVSAKVEYYLIPEGARLSIIAQLRKMPVSEVGKTADGIHRKMSKMLDGLVADLKKVPAMSKVSYELPKADSFFLACNSSGPYLRIGALLKFEYDGDRDMKWQVMHELLDPVFKRASDGSEVVEEEEIEPQGSTPVKQQRKKAD